MVRKEPERLRVLIANERSDRIASLATVIDQLGHEVVAGETDVRTVGQTAAREHPDVAVVGLGESSEHALDLIERIGQGSSCPVIALLSGEDPEFIREAARRGVFAYIVHADPAELESAFEITLRRYSDYRNLLGAFARRAVIEQAKGILMARHAIDADSAFEMLRQHSQRAGEKIIEVAEAIVHSHMLLVPAAAKPSPT